MIASVTNFIVLAISSGFLVQGLNTIKGRTPNYDLTQCIDKDGTVLPKKVNECTRIEQSIQCFNSEGKIIFLGWNYCDKFNYSGCYIKDGQYKSSMEKQCSYFIGSQCFDKNHNEMYIDNSKCDRYNNKDCYEKNGKFFPTFAKGCLEPTSFGCKAETGDAHYDKGVCDSYNNQ